jgi:hypothetical protein
MTNKDWLVLSIITFLTVAVWTIFDIYHAAINTTTTPAQEALIEPLDPTLNTEVFDTIKQRKD